MRWFNFSHITESERLGRTSLSLADPVAHRDTGTRSQSNTLLKRSPYIPELAHKKTAHMDTTPQMTLTTDLGLPIRLSTRDLWLGFLLG